jgi:exodeoxyribonuclease V alpha subunit
MTEPDVRLTTHDVLRYLADSEIPSSQSGSLGHALYRDPANPELKDFLRAHGFRIALHASEITQAQLNAMQRLYRAETLDLLRTDPFQMIGRVRGMTYLKASQIWRRIGPRADDDTLALAAVREVVRRGRERGDIWLNRASVLTKARELCARRPSLISEALDHYLATGGLTQVQAAGLTMLVRTPALEMEHAIAARLRMLDQRYAHADRFDIFTAMRGAGILSPDPLQMEAVALALENQLCVITGGPGTGKSTILRAVRMLLQADTPGIRLRLVALAARVAREIGTKTGIPAETVHTTLGLGPEGRPVHGPGHPIPADVVFVEEGFMLGNALFADLLAALAPQTRLVIVGDPEQLPPILEGKPVEAMLQSGRIPTIRLTTNHRSESADIPHAGQRVMRGLPIRPTGNVRRIPSGTVRDALTQVCQTFDALKARGDTVQILTAMHQGPLGTAAINQAVAGRIAIGVGDAVMQTENDRDRNILNGEIGTVVAALGTTLIVERDDGSTVVYEKAQIRQLVHAWAITYHKSQGLEYDHVILVASPTQQRMLSRNLVNVGITRAKRTCTIIDHRDGLRSGIAVELNNRRTSLLDRILRGELTT